MIEFINGTVIAVLMHAPEPISLKSIIRIIHDLEISRLSPEPNIFDKILEEEALEFFNYDKLIGCFEIHFIFQTKKRVLIPNYGAFDRVVSIVDKNIWKHVEDAIAKKTPQKLTLESFDSLKAYSKEMLESISKAKRESIILKGLNGTNLKIHLAAVEAGFQNPNPDIIKIIGKLIKRANPEIYYVFYLTMWDRPPQFISMIVDGATSDDTEFQKSSTHLLNVVFRGGPQGKSSGPIEILKGFWLKDLSTVEKLVLNEDQVIYALIRSRGKQKYLSHLKGIVNILDVRAQRPVFEILEGEWLDADLPILENIDCSYDPLAPEEYRLKELVRLNWPGTAILIDQCLIHRRQAVRDEALRSLGKLGDLAKLKEIQKDTLQKIAKDKLNEVRFSLDAIAEAIAFCKNVTSNRP